MKSSAQNLTQIGLAVTLPCRLGADCWIAPGEAVDGLGFVSMAEEEMWTGVGRVDGPIGVSRRS